MKKTIKTLFVIFILVFLIFTNSCTSSGGSDLPDDDTKIIITTKQDVINLKDSEVENFDYTSYFTITEDDKEVIVLNSYIDDTKVSLKNGEYFVTCSYKGKSEKIKVVVSETNYELNLVIDEISLHVSKVLEYNFIELFSAYVDGNKVEITNDMISTNVTDCIGSYSYSVTLNNITKTLKVNVTDEYVIEIMETYKELELSIDELKTFDYTSLFSLYVEGIYENVTLDMIDKSELNNPIVGNIYKVNITYTKGSSTKKLSTNVKVVENDVIKITTRNIIIPPNGGNIDLTDLFEIKEGKNIVPVTMDMITGSINYTTVGNNTITVSYKGQSANANVEVKLGVIINYAYSDSIIIAKGTKQSDYSFINDFEVIINGIRFKNISDSYLDISNVDFNTVGTYQVTLTLPFNDNKIGLSGVNFTYVEKTINYVVVDNNYNIQVLEDVVYLNEGISEYDVYRNLKVTINNRNQTLTEIKEYVDTITCYVKTISQPIDFNNKGLQEVKVEVYVNGVDKAPIEVTYHIIIKSDLIIDAQNKVIFVGEDVNPKELFTITENGNNIEISIDMLSGKINQDIAGTYLVSINYKGLEQSAKVVVFDNNIKGTYKTNLDNVNDMYNGSTSDDDDDENPIPVTKVTDLYIKEDGSISFNGKDAKIVDAIDEKTMIIQYGSYTYTLYYDNGIIVLDPENEIKLTYTVDKRPFIYFNTNIWSIENKLLINQYTSHVLTNVSVTYSIDAFNIKSKINNKNIWYGLKVHLVEKTSSDTIYVVTWGEMEFAPNFVQSTGNSSYVSFNNDKYEFVMTSNDVATVDKNASGESYANRVFTGVIDGKSAELRSDQYEGFTLFINDQFIFKLGSYELDNLLNGGLNKDTKTILFYEYEEEVFSYKFILNLDNNTFTYIEKDINFGYYEYNDMYIFLDGYGTGLINFDKKHYYKYQFTYSQNLNIITCDFFNTKPSFEYGTHFEVYISPLLNVLTIKYSLLDSIIGNEFKNCNVVDGAIVNISSYQVGQDADSVAKNELYKNIEIITKDGVLDNTQKASMIDTSRIRFSVPGFYQFTITSTVNGKQVVSYYAVEVLKSIYESSPIVNTYGNGVIYETNSLSIDKYGRVVLDANGVIYNGSIRINSDNTFVINATNDKNVSITGNGALVANGIISLRCFGGLTFSDYFTIGTTNVVGTNSFVLREFKVGNNITYILSNVASALGKIVDIELISGTEIISVNSIIKVVTTDSEYYAKVLVVNNSEKGLVLADQYRGSYTLEGSETITLDGFDRISFGNNIGTYSLNGSYVTAVFEDEVKIFKLDINNKSYSIVDIKLDNSLVMNKTFSASYYFSCDSYLYSATTTFKFGENGKVIITSESYEHDLGDDACPTDKYSPIFVNKNASYSVSGNKIIITTNGVTLEFTITNLLSVDYITSSNSSLDSNEHGYYSNGTIFMIEK